MGKFFGDMWKGFFLFKFIDFVVFLFVLFCFLLQFTTVHLTSGQDRGMIGGKDSRAKLVWGTNNIVKRTEWFWH